MRIDVRPHGIPECGYCLQNIHCAECAQDEGWGVEINKGELIWVCYDCRTAIER